MFYLMKEKETGILYIWETLVTQEEYVSLVQRIDESIVGSEKMIRDYLGTTYGMTMISPKHFKQIKHEVIGTSESLEKIIEQVTFELI